jgi:gliding motility-associated-like protein
MSNQDFEHIIKEKFDNASSSIPSGAWAEVSAQLSSSATSSGLFTSILGKVAAVVLLTSVVAVTVLTLSSDVSKETVQNTEITKEETSILFEESTLSEPANTEENKTDISEVKEEKNSIEKRAVVPPAIRTPEIPEEISEDIQEVILGALEQSSSVNSNQSNDELTSQETSEPNPYIDAEANTVALSVVMATKISSIQLDAKKSVFSYKLNQPSSSQQVNWYINDVLTSEESSFNHEFTAAGEFTIMARMYNEKSVLVNTLFHNEMITLEPLLFMPNTFTPQSSSGYNDVFDIDTEKSENILWYEIFIFNVEGTLVFKSDDDLKNWNGLDVNQNLAPEGAYIYLVNYKSESGKTYSERGKVVLQR